MLCVLTAAALGVRALRWGDIIWATAKLCVEAATLLVGAVGGVHKIIAAAPFGILAGSRVVTALEVESLGPGDPVRTAAILCECAVLIDLPVLVRAAFKLWPSGSILEIRTTAKLCLLTRVTEEHFIWTSKAALLLRSLRKCSKREDIIIHHCNIFLHNVFSCEAQLNKCAFVSICLSVRPS